eukprot:5826318-Prymnesium_polylepis.1
MPYAHQIRPPSLSLGASGPAQLVCERARRHASSVAARPAPPHPRFRPLQSRHSDAIATHMAGCYDGVVSSCSR